MSPNVVEFPTRLARKWAGFERFIPDMLQQQYGATPEMMNEVCGRMKECWKKLDVDISLPFRMVLGLNEKAQKAFDDSFQKLKEGLAYQIGKLVKEILLDRLNMEVELYNLRHPEVKKP